MITVTYLSPWRVCLHTSSSTPMTLTPSKRFGSSIGTGRYSATRATVRGQADDAFQRPAKPATGQLRLGSEAFNVSCRHSYTHPAQRERRTLSNSVVGRHPKSSWANSLVTVSHGTHWLPYGRHPSSAFTTRQAITARSTFRNCPIASGPRCQGGRKWSGQDDGRWL